MSPAAGRRGLLMGRTALFMLLGLLIAAGGASAATRAGTDKTLTYRWVDEHGVVHYGDSVPAQYAQKEQAVLNSQGVEVKRLDAQKTPDELAADNRRQQEQLRQKQHDSFLMTTYTSVKDIEALRDLRLDQLRGQRVAAEQYVENLHARLYALQVRAMNFRPYNDKPQARRMPDDLAEDLVRTLNEFQTQKGVLVAKGEEETHLRAQFQTDIERYQMLRSPPPQANNLSATP
ncbi:MAG: DUF4124 domain-containing protein [Sinobacteraceae bacterium]|nr:DUF4124 domain-containing protein [Nevskiaceae bacterium]